MLVAVTRAGVGPAGACWRLRRLPRLAVAPPLRRVADASTVHALPRGTDLPPRGLIVIRDAITPEEEREMVQYLDPLLRRKRYLNTHFDEVISKYREKEMTWESPPAAVTAVWDRLAAAIRGHFGADLKLLTPHIIDLHADGCIGPHVDSVKFSGGLVCSLSLLSSRVLRLTPDPLQAEAENWNSKPFPRTMPDVVEVVIEPRCFYMLSGPFRYLYCHSVLGRGQEPAVIPDGERIPDSAIGRRISVMFRDELVADPPGAP